MAKIPTQSRKMASPKKFKARDYSEETTGSPIMMLAKFITDRKGRKASEREQAIYKDAIEKLNSKTKKPAAKPKAKEKPRSLLARASYGK